MLALQRQRQVQVFRVWGKKVTRLLEWTYAESRSSSDSVDASSSIHGMIQKLIDSGEEKDRRHERILQKREIDFHTDEQWHAEELYLKKRIFEESNAIDNYQFQLALTEKTVFGQLILARKQEELSTLQAELEGVKTDLSIAIIFQGLVFQLDFLLGIGHCKSWSTSYSCQ